VRGETVVIAAPVIGAPVANERPPVKQTIAAAAVDLGWGAIANQDEAKKIRKKMKSEAAPPAREPEKRFVKADAAISGTTQRSETSDTSPSATATSAQSASAATSPVATATAISTPIPSVSPSPTGSPVVPTGSPQRVIPHGKFQSQAQRFQPRRVQPMPTPSPSATATSAPSANPASGSSTTLSGKLTRQEENEQKRQEKKELKRERKERFENASPSATPN
jgi:hypothetical protein